MTLLAKTASRHFLAFFLLILAGPAFQALAHPLGNFTINRYSRLELNPESIRILYIVDMAEIPAFQELGRMDADGDSAISDEERGNYLATTANRLVRGLQLTIDEITLTPQLISRELTTPPGQGGLKTLRLNLMLQADFAPGKDSKARQAHYQDNNYSQRPGWKEIVVRPLQKVTLLNSDVPPQDQSAELLSYPRDQLSAPLDVHKASWTFAPAGSPSLVETDTSLKPNAKTPQKDRLVDILAVDRNTLPLMLFALLIAAGLGALHALSPGHGKAIVGAYLVGTRGTVKQALILGFTVTLTHTAGVFALGLVTLYASRYLLPEQLYPWLGSASGLTVAVMGAFFLQKRLRSKAHSLPHAHHGHDHGHDHLAHGHTHPHLATEDHGHPHEPAPSLRNLLMLGVSGGLLPCPSALVVLLGAIALNRIGFGLLLIFAFSLGLATVLTLVGILFIYAKDLFCHWHHGRALLKFMPVASALVIFAAGIGITVQGVWQAF
jgi:ABC-type nickel/cobalt efflux system permease component RcnA